MTSKEQQIMFRDIGGCSEAKEEAAYYVNYLKNRKQYMQEHGAPIPTGVLLVGKPGSGRKLLAKAIAGEAGVPFHTLYGSESIAQWQQMLDRRQTNPTRVIFIEELGSLAWPSGQPCHPLLHSLLSWMDTVARPLGVLVFARVTDPKSDIASCLLQSGRFDREIKIEWPDLDCRRKIFRLYLEKMGDRLSEGDHVIGQGSRELAAISNSSFSGHHIAVACHNAQQTALTEKLSGTETGEVRMRHLVEAVVKLATPAEIYRYRCKRLSLKDRELLSYHQAGHAIVRWFSANAPRTRRVSINAGHFNDSIDSEGIKTKKMLFEETCALLGGGAAEKLLRDDKSLMVADDNIAATKLAYALATHFSDELGNLAFDKNEQHCSGQDVQKVINKEAKEWLARAGERAERLVSLRREQVVQLAELLVEKEVVKYEELVEILGKECHFEVPALKEEEVTAKDNAVKKILLSIIILCCVFLSLIACWSRYQIDELNQIEK